MSIIDYLIERGNLGSMVSNSLGKVRFKLENSLSRASVGVYLPTIENAINHAINISELSSQSGKRKT